MPDVMHDAVNSLVWLSLAYALALPIGWEREATTRSRNAGVRTFPLVAMAGCGFVLLGATLQADDPSALSRVVVGVVTGIGFIGGGAILKRGATVRGTSTAASLWLTAGIGVAVGLHRPDIAIALAAAAFATIRLAPPLKAAATDRSQEAVPED